MALVLKDRVKETSTTTGTGTFTLAGAATGFQSFSAIGNGNTTYYCITRPGSSEWEVGIGTYTLSGTTLSRDSILASSNSNSAVNFGVGSKDVFVTYPASTSVITDTLASPPAIGGTTPAAGTFTTFIGGKDQVNYGQLTGGATTKAVEFKTLGSDTNVSYAIRSQGTGAIDLAAGSSGVNISNGGTVTAVTKTSDGANYTSLPTVAIAAPTTAGGVQAVLQLQMYQTPTVIVNGGTGYTVGDVLTIVGGTPVTTASAVTVTSVSGGVITGVSRTNFNAYTALPSSPVSVTGGTGTGATFTLVWGVGAFAITNAGSGYVEQPAITVTGGGGSPSAAAYATVGSGTVVKSLGSTLSFYTPNGEGFRVVDTGTTSTQYWQGLGGSNAILRSSSTAYVESSGANSINFRTNSGTLQLAVAHTASAVNYVQVTGAATGNRPVISAQGSDTNIGLLFAAKGTTLPHVFLGSGGSTNQFVISNNGAGTNYLQTASAATTVAPSLSSQGSDTNIDLALIPKGTGVVKHGSNIALDAGNYTNYTDPSGTAVALSIALG